MTNQNSGTGVATRCQFQFSDGRCCRMLRSPVHSSFCAFHARQELQLLESQRLGDEISVGPDGNFYFVSGNVVLVLSAYGDFVKRIPIPKPEDDARASVIAIAGDLISIQFKKGDKDGLVHTQFLVLSLSTGNAYGLYVPAEELGNNCVCFSSRSGYTFLRVENGKLKFVNAPLT